MAKKKKLYYNTVSGLIVELVKIKKNGTVDVKVIYTPWGGDIGDIIIYKQKTFWSEFKEAV